MEHTIAYHIASLVQAIENCGSDSANGSQREWELKHARRLAALVKEYMPSGSGWDMGTKFDIDASRGDKLVFTGEFHHMDADMYAGWTAHRVTALPLFDDVALNIGGFNRNSIKDHLYELFYAALTQRVDKATIDALYLAAD